MDLNALSEHADTESLCHMRLLDCRGSRRIGNRARYFTPMISMHRLVQLGDRGCAAIACRFPAACSTNRFPWASGCGWLYLVAWFVLHACSTRCVIASDGSPSACFNMCLPVIIDHRPI